MPPLIFTMPDCLQNIISLNCGEETGTSLSGLDLYDAPEISPKQLAAISNEKYIAGTTLATAKYNLALKLVRNDVLGILSASNVMPNLAKVQYQTGVFKDTVITADDVNRGLILFRNRRIRGALTKTIIHNIKVYPFADAASVDIVIEDDYAGGTVTTYPVELVANEVNLFNVEYAIQGTYARVYIDGTDLPVATTYMTCHTGCNGSLPNSCAYAVGYYNGIEISALENYGIVLDFSCECDYDLLLCNLAPTWLGEIVWLKTRVLILEEHVKSNRFDNFVIYNRDETKEYLVDVDNQYRTKWNTFVNSLPNIVKTFRDDCLSCEGVRWVDNI